MSLLLRTCCRLTVCYPRGLALPGWCGTVSRSGSSTSSSCSSFRGPDSGERYEFALSNLLSPRYREERYELA